MQAAGSMGEIVSQIHATSREFRERTWHEALQEKWTALAGRNAFGPPTHERLQVQLKYDGMGRCRAVTETSRVPVWLAPSAGTYTARKRESGGETDYRTDVWIDAGLTVWLPYNSTQDHGGGIGYRDRDFSTEREIVVPSGAPLRTHVIREVRSPRGQRELVDGVVVFTFSTQAPFSPRCDYVDAVIAVLSR
jgi:hypothetical protein